MNTFEGPCVGILIDRGEFTDSHHKTVYMCLNGITKMPFIKYIRKVSFNLFAYVGQSILDVRSS